MKASLTAFVFFFLFVHFFNYFLDREQCIESVLQLD